MEVHARWFQTSSSLPRPGLQPCRASGSSFPSVGLGEGLLGNHEGPSSIAYCFCQGLSPGRDWALQITLLDSVPYL